jgi:hypothetical protein
MARILGLEEQVIQEALEKLVANDLIARQGQVVQVLPIPVSKPEITPPTQRPQSRLAPMVNQPAKERSVVSQSAISHCEESETQPLIKECDVQSHLPQARARLARFLGSKAPADSSLRALARSLAIQDRRSSNG